MKFYFHMLFMLVLIATIPAGCNQNNERVGGHTVKQIKSFYPADIYNVNRIEILNSAGERKKIDNKELVEQWLDQIGELNVTVDPNREDHSGNLFIVTCFESE